MIKSFRSKALKKFATIGDASKLPVLNADRVAVLLGALNAATTPEDMNLPGLFFHGLHGKPKRYSIRATGNFRITFGWEDGDAIHVDLQDYH